MTSTAPDSVYEVLRSDILDSRLLPGVVISENSLAAQLGVSRTPVREALFRLEQDGLLYRGPRGMEVRARSPEEILDIYEVRSALEAVAARDAAQRRRDIDIATLTRLNRDFASTINSYADGEANPAVANMAFHQAIWQTARNAACMDALSRLQAHLGRYSGTTLTAPGRGEAAVAEHSAILEAIIRQDAEAAAALAAEHMSKAKQVRLTLFAEAMVSGAVIEGRLSHRQKSNVPEQGIVNTIS